MKTIRLLLPLVLSVVAMAAKGQDRNVLRVPDVDGVEGRSVNVTVELDNANPEITAMQFILTLPEEALSPNTGNAKLTGRAADHTVSVDSKGGGRYQVIIYSLSNAVFSANRGTVLEIPCVVKKNVVPDKTYQLTIEECILSDREGNNVLSLSEGGSFRINTAADLTVCDVSVKTTSVGPGGALSVDYTVRNIGGSCSGKWTEKVYLATKSSVEEVFLGSVNPCVSGINEDASLSRTAELTLPEIPGIDGKADVVVKIVPESVESEPMSYRDNNTGKTSGLPLRVEKMLTLTPASVSIEEAGGKGVKCKLTRSGNRSVDQTFDIILSPADTRLLVPEQVTIPAGQSAAFFMIKAVDNDVCDESGAIRLDVSGNGYQTVSSILTVIDDEQPELSLTSSAETISEGENLTLTIGRTFGLANPLDVALSCDMPARFTFPATVYFAAGEISKTVTVASVDNEDIEMDAIPLFTASAPGYLSDDCAVTLRDNDAPEIELTLTPGTVSENAGPVAVTAKLRRLSGSDTRMKFTLSDDSDGDIYYHKKSMILEKGVSEIEFPLGVIDNSIQTRDRKVNIMAAVNLASCGCSVSAGSKGSASASLEIIEDDGPALRLTSSLSTLATGKNGLTLTVSRNTPTDESIAVSLSSDADDMLAYSREVVLPAGSPSTQVNVSLEVGKVPDRDRIVTFTAESARHSKGTCWFIVSNGNLPDASIPAFTLSGNDILDGDSIRAFLKVRNEGVAVFPEASRVDVYADGQRRATVYTSKALSGGEEDELTAIVPVNAGIGELELYASVNDDRKIRELNYGNNNSQTVKVNVNVPYLATVSTDKKIYSPGETVTVNGLVTGRKVSDQPVEVYVINDRLRQKMDAVTDADGAFSVAYTPYTGQAGHFSVGACYPGENKRDEGTGFDIYGLARADRNTVKTEVYVNESASMSFGIRNSGALALTGINVKVVSAPEDCMVKVSAPSALAGNQKGVVHVTVKPESLTEGNLYQTVKLELETAEGVSLQVPVYYLSISPKGLLKSDLESLNARIVKGAVREYPITISNQGDGVTGEITLSSPEWITLKEGALASLPGGESVQATLLLSAGEDFQLNSIREGSVAFNCENGTGFKLPFAIETVSDSKGTLIVDATDEYTYHTAEAPHLAGAKVLVEHPATNAKIAEGITDTDGIFSVSLEEGWYRLTVSADKHQTYSNMIVVEPGDEPTCEVTTLGYIAHRFEFSVEETEEEDKYEVTEKPSFETDVPVPVVTIDGPERFNGDDMADGESILLKYKLTNQGLITAFNTTFTIPEDGDEWTWELLGPSEPFQLEPKESVELAVKVTRHLTANPASSRRRVTNAVSQFQNCVDQYKLLYEHMCGKDWKDNYYAKRVMMKMCADEALGSLMGGLLLDAFGGLPGGGGGGVPQIPRRDSDSPNKAGEKEPVPYNKDRTLCNPCWAEYADKTYDRVWNKIPIVGKYLTQAKNDAYEQTQGSESKPSKSKARISTRKVRDFITSLIRKRVPEGMARDTYDDVMGIANDAIDYEECLNDLSKKGSEKEEQTSRVNSPRRVRKAEGWVIEHREIAIQLQDQYAHYMAALNEFYGDSVWYMSDDPSIDVFLNAFSEMDDWSLDACRAIKPEAVTVSQLEAFVERMNNTINNTGTNRCDIDAMLAELRVTDTADGIAAEKGYESMSDLFPIVHKEFLSNLDEQTSAVCASVTLAIDQTVSMTRQAFKGYLKVFNGDDTNPMDNLVFNLDVRDTSTGKKVTPHEMQIDVVGLETFKGEAELGKPWILDPQATGKVSVRFIPTHYAAPDKAVDFSFGGTVSYIDPITGLQMTEKLMPVYKTVRPSPVLDMTYFLQRDVYGDAPLTEETEPSEEAEMALVVHNKGKGDATNMRIVTSQPRIEDNEKGLDIRFDITSSQLNGGEKTLSLGGDIPLEIGTITASESSLLQWWLQSPLLGHFTDYKVDYTHATSYGNEDLSLLDEVTIHELTHGFTVSSAGAVPLRGFLVNDIEDKDDAPDAVYFSDGRVAEPLSMARSLEMSPRGDDEYFVKVVPSAAGWNYGSIADRTGGAMMLTGVRRASDNTDVPSDNFWQTSVTLRDGQDPVHEYLIHAVADLQEEDSYILAFAPRPETDLDVAGMELVRGDDSGVAYVTAVRVVFNKGIARETFSNSSVVLFYDGSQLALESDAVEAVSDIEFNVNLDNKASKAGAYELKVLTTNVTDCDGQPGKSNRSVAWTQEVSVDTGTNIINADGEVHISPMPMKDRISVNGCFSRITGIEAIDAGGAVIRLDADADNTVDVSGLSRGIHILRIATDRGVSVKKAVKL